jgi:hypothetical protein
VRLLLERQTLAPSFWRLFREEACQVSMHEGTNSWLSLSWPYEGSQKRGVGSYVFDDGTKRLRLEGGRLALLA